MMEEMPHRVAVVGAGTMGQGIATVAAMHGYAVTLTDANPTALAKAMTYVESTLDAGVTRGKLSADDRDAARARIAETATIATAVHGAEIVIEAVPESLALKQALFAEIGQHVSPETLLATNTSSLSVTAIAQGVDNPTRVIGMHFFNPVIAMKLIELVRGATTSDTTVERARAFVTSLGKTPIVVRDTPGFATSRLGVVLGLEAMRMLEQGVASAEDIDRAMELGYNHPLGPLKLTDLVGLDIRLAIADHLHRELGDDTYAAPDILRAKVAQGHLGKKSGEGFYHWDAQP